MRELEETAQDEFPFFGCEWARSLAERSPAFAKQLFPDPREDDASDDGLERDPFGEEEGESGCCGLLQRFPDRVLVMVSNACFMNCRHCTRRWLLRHADVVRTDEELAACVAYVQERPKVRDVLLSGGDPLVLPDEEVMRFVDSFAGLPQVDVVRLCTRAPCANPGRVTDALAAALGASGKVWAQVQFNHADELTPEAVAACGRLVDRGIPVSCQTVMLAGVNDSADAMLDLFRALQRARVRPYYVFMCDPVAGTGHFQVPVARAKEIAAECARSIGGLGLPRFVADIPGADSKTPLEEL